MRFCVDEVRLQLDSFSSHAATPPLILVGTRKGQLPDATPAALAQLSEKMEEELRGHPALRNLVRNTKEGGLAFFGVENEKGFAGDPSFLNLLLSIDQVASELPAMKQGLPAGWIAVYDRLQSMLQASPSRPHLSRAEVLEIDRD